VLGTIDIMLITENAMIILSVSIPFQCIDRCAVDIPDGHARAGNLGEADGSRETLITLGIVVLETDLKLNSLEKVTLLGFERVFKDFLDVRTHSGCGATFVSDCSSKYICGKR
jgi:hypothetical protein